MRLLLPYWLLLWTIVAVTAHADVLVDESFDYDPGPIVDQDGGSGWFEPWLVSDPFFETDFNLNVIEPEPPLIYQVPGGGVVNGGSRALRLSNDDPEALIANETMALTRGYDQILDGDEVFFSFLYRYDGDGTETGGTIDDNDFVVWWMNGPGGPQAGLKGNFGNGSSPDDFVGRVSGAFAPPQQAYAPGIDISLDAGTLNADWLVVGRMSRQDHSDAEGDYDQFDLWINPALAEADAPHATAMGEAGDALALDFELIGLRVFNQEPGDAMIWDELRLGETWEDVVGPLGDQDVVVDLPGDCNGDGVVDAADLQCACVSGTLDDVLAATGLLRGDLDGDGEVGFPDFLALSANFGQSVDDYPMGDIDCDGEVGFPDFLALSANFGQSAGGVAAVPEPSASLLSMLACCAGAIVWRRRK